MSEAERGRAIKIGEGRRTSSRSSSRSSSTTCPLLRRAPSPDSGDERVVAATTDAPKDTEAVEVANAGSCIPIVRPAISRWGTSLAATAFGPINTSSNFFKPQTNQLSETSNHLGESFSPVSGPPSSLAQPSGSVGQARNNQRSVSDASSEASATGPASSSRATSVPAIPVPLSFHDFINPRTPIVNNAAPTPTPTLPTKVKITPRCQPILPTKALETLTPGSSLPPTSILPTKVKLPSTIQQSVAGVAPQPILPTKVLPPVQNYYRQNLASPDDSTGYSERSYYRDKTPGGSNYQSRESDGSPSGPTVVQDTLFNQVEPTSGASTKSTKGRKGKKAAQAKGDTTVTQRKKRGDWRVQGYRDDPAASPAPEPAADQVQNIGRHKSAFKAYGYQRGSEIQPEAAVAPPAFVAEPVNLNMAEERIYDIDVDNAFHVEPPSVELFQHQAQATDTAALYASNHIEEMQPRTLPSSPAVLLEESFSETLVSRASSNSIPSNHAPSDLQSPFQDDNVASTSNSRSQAPQIPQPPTIRLVSVVIEDNRFGESDEQLVEMRLPLKPAKDDTFWADAVDVCNNLQQGPSRIDGPAKVYTYRGRYRQFFLRVSADDTDVFASANLAVSAKRVLRIYVDPGPTQSTAPMNHQAHSDNLPSSASMYGGRLSQPPKRPFEQPVMHYDGAPANIPGSWQPPGMSNKRPRFGSSDPHVLDQSGS